MILSFRSKIRKALATPMIIRIIIMILLRRRGRLSNRGLIITGINFLSILMKKLIMMMPPSMKKSMLQMRSSCLGVQRLQNLTYY